MPTPARRATSPIERISISIPPSKKVYTPYHTTESRGKQGKFRGGWRAKQLFDFLLVCLLLTSIKGSKAEVFPNNEPCTSRAPLHMKRMFPSPSLHGTITFEEYSAYL